MSIPSHVIPHLEALRKELKEVNSWIEDIEKRSVFSEYCLGKVSLNLHEVNQLKELQNKHITQYKLIAERKAKEIKEFENKYNLNHDRTNIQ